MRSWSACAQDLRSHRSRAVLNGLSLFVGVLAVVGIFTAGSVVQDVFVAQEEQRAGRAPTVVATVEEADGARLLTTAEDAQARLGARGSAVARLSVPLEVRTLRQRRMDEPGLGVAGVWTSGDLPGVRRLPLTAGRWIAGGAPAQPSLVMNTAAARRLGAHVDQVVAVSTSSHRQDLRLRVVGVVADGTSDPTVYGDLRYLDAWDAPATANATDAGVLLHVAGGGAPVMSQLLGDAARDTSSTLSGPPVRVDRVAELQVELSRVRTVFAWCAAVALLVSALGILNIGLASISQRSHELVVRRAVGARRSEVFSLVLGSSILVSLLAAAVAVGTAVVAVLVVVPSWLPVSSALDPPGFPVQAAVAGVLAAVVTSALGGAVPAFAASRLSIASVLRE